LSVLGSGKRKINTDCSTSQRASDKIQVLMSLSALISFLWEPKMKSFIAEQVNTVCSLNVIGFLTSSTTKATIFFTDRATQSKKL